MLARIQMAKKKSNYHRAYSLPHAINAGKQQKMRAVVPHYKKAQRAIASEQWKDFFLGQNFNSYAEINIQSKLIARYLRDACKQTVGSLESWLSNRQNDFIRISYHAGLSEETRKDLLLISNYQLWYRKNPVEHVLFLKKIPEEVKIQVQAIPSATYKLARQIMRHLFSRHRKPSFNDGTLNLSVNTAEIQKNDGSSFDTWVRFSSLEAKKPLYLPLRKNPYMDSQAGKTCNSLQFVFRPDGQIDISRAKENKLYQFRQLEDQSYQPQTDAISLDTGLVFPLATDRGDLYGHSFFTQLKKYDARLLQITKELQRQKIQLRTNKRYLAVQRDIKAYLKNEIHRIINKIVGRYQPAKIIIDSLNFQDVHLSRQLNRILRRCGLGVIKQKLATLEEELGIKIIWINPAYTSQTCDRCGWVDKKNRHGREFLCRWCQHNIHADVLGARNGRVRSSDSDITLYTRKDEVLRLLVKRFISHLVTEQSSKRLCSKAKILLDGNPYFNGVEIPSRDQRVFVD